LQPRVRERFSVGNYAREIEKNYRGAIWITQEVV
jgi:hypothetical protein